MRGQMNFWSGKLVLVTGGFGFLGSHMVDILRRREALVVTFRSQEYNLTDQGEVYNLFQRYQTTPFDVVIHLAARVGGIGANQTNPAMFLRDNLLMGINVLDGARFFKAKKVVMIGTVCSYPKNTPIPFHEEDLWNGYPEETNAPYGIAKKTLLTFGQSLRQQYGLNVIYLIPTNLYGPRDDFDPKTSHVIPAIIKRLSEAKKLGDDYVHIWGTGEATRDFLYVEDAAKAIVIATELYDKPDPVNLGTGVETSIKKLVREVQLASGMGGRELKIIWETSKPDGQPRRVLDISKAKREFGWIAETELWLGLKKTVDWYTSSDW